ncbi:Alanine--tRNA ligase, partial [Nowakowskiella sp. JEL0078]
VRKNKLREEFAVVKSVFAEADKVKKAKDAKESVDGVNDYFVSNPETEFLVRVLNVGSNTKAIAQAITHVKGLKNKSALLLAVDTDAGKVALQSVVAKEHIDKGLKANEWAQIVAGLTGGKSGGKEDAAQGSGSDTTKVEEAVLAAQTYAKKFVV